MPTRLATACCLALLAMPPQNVPRPIEAAPIVSARPTVAIDRLPWTIVAPGRYVLMGTLQMPDDPAPEAASGIVIRSDDVVLDLGGHSLLGSKGSTSGVSVELPDRRTSVLLDVTVRNGTVRNWGGHGVDLSTVAMARAEDLVLAGNGVARKEFDGLFVGEDAIVRRCSSQYNATAGIRAGRGSQLVECTGSSNGGPGLVLGSGGVARACKAADNAGDGLVLAGAGCTAADCSTSNNGRHGINASPSARIADCTSYANKGSGFRVEGSGLVQGCLASGNAGAGILALERGTRVDGNHLSANGIGLDVAGRGHVVVRNTLTGNGTTWSLPDGNFSGGLQDASPLSLTIKAYKPPSAGAGGGTPDAGEESLPEVVPAWTNFDS